MKHRIYNNEIILFSSDPFTLLQEQRPNKLKFLFNSKYSFVEQFYIRKFSIFEEEKEEKDENEAKTFLCN